MTARHTAIADIAGGTVSSTQDYTEHAGEEIFGQYVFHEVAQRAYLPKPIFFKRFFWFSLQKTHEIRKCCLYDWYAPRYHHEHTALEVMGWFREHGFPEPKYINAWPYCPPEIKYAIPTFKDSFRIGQLLGVIGKKREAARACPRSMSIDAVLQ